MVDIYFGRNLLIYNSFDFVRIMQSCVMGYNLVNPQIRNL